jgi:hypothetical protein
MNARTGAIVADIMNNVLKPDEFAWQSVQLLRHYRNPAWYPEDNDWGATTIDAAKALNYPNFGYQDEKRTKIGWHTHASGFISRQNLMNKLVQAFNNFQVTIFNYKGLLQFGDLIRNTEKDGRIEAMKGKCDDYPIAVAIALEKSADVLKKSNYSFKPIKTLQFEPRRLARV